MNLFFQGPNSFIPDYISKLEAFVRKLDIWMKNVDSREFGMFRFLSCLPRQPTEKLCEEIEEISCHLKQLKTELMHYFPVIKCCGYITNPFPVNPSLLPVGTDEQEDITDIQSDESAKTMHKECNEFLAEHVLYISEFGTKSYSAAFGIPRYTGMWAGFLCLEYQN